MVKRHLFLGVRVLAVCSVLVASVVASACQPTTRYSVGQAAPLAAGATIRCTAAAETSVGVQLTFEVSNSSGADLGIPSRPVRPTVIGPDGKPLQLTSIETSITGGGGGFGPAAAGNPPYLGPGGVMHVVAAIDTASIGVTLKPPLTVTYAPLGQEQVSFVVVPAR